MKRAGVDLLRITRLFGHSDLSLLQRYIKLTNLIFEIPPLTPHRWVICAFDFTYVLRKAITAMIMAARYIKSGLYFGFMSSLQSLLT